MGWRTMRRRDVQLTVVMCLVAMLACDRRRAPPAAPPGERIHSVSRGMSLRPPHGWTFRDTSYSINHYTDIIGIACNTQEGIVAPHDSVWAVSGGQAIGCPPSVIRAQLPAGSVAVLFTQPGGPPGDWMWDFHQDTVGERLADGLDTLSTQWILENGLAARHTRFWKWSEFWTISAYARQPLAPADREAVQELLATVEFPRVPVVQAQQALRCAWQVLPTDLRGSRLPGCPTPPGSRIFEGGTIRGTHTTFIDVELGSGMARRRTKVEKQGTAFAVTFETWSQAREGGAPRSWSCVVGADGVVSAIVNRAQ